MEIVIFTKGAAGSELHFKDGTKISHEGFKVKAVDTTGAGDAFIGAMLSKILNFETTNLTQELKQQGKDILGFSNFVAAKVTTNYGAIGSIPTLEEINNSEAL